jgi:hypothetical protein
LEQNLDIPDFFLHEYQIKKKSSSGIRVDICGRTDKQQEAFDEYANEPKMPAAL